MRQVLRFSLGSVALALCFIPRAIVPDLPTSNWPYAGQFGTATQKWSGVAIGDRWVLTARHVAFMGDTEGRFVMDGGPEYASIRVYRHPTDDLAVIEFPNPLPGWYPIYTGSSEIGMVGEVIGYGITGEIVGGEYQYTGNGGTKRAGRNRLSLSQFVQFTEIQGVFLICDFDGSGRDTFGDGGPVMNECTLGSGDSGGPTLVNDGGVWKVAGVHSWVGNVTGGPTAPRHGSVFGDIQVSNYAAWINSIVPQRVTPTILNVNPGIIVGGDVGSLAFSDNVRVRIREVPPLALGAPSVRAVIDGVSPILAPGTLTFRIETSTSAVPASSLLQRIEMRNFQTGVWELVDQRSTTSGDNMIVITPAGSASRFVEPITGVVRSRASWFDPGTLFSFGWEVRIDMAIWEVLP